MGQVCPSRIPRYGTTPGSRPWFMVRLTPHAPFNLECFVVRLRRAGELCYSLVEIHSTVLACSGMLHSTSR